MSLCGIRAYVTSVTSPTGVCDGENGNGRQVAEVSIKSRIGFRYGAGQHLHCVQ